MKISEIITESKSSRLPVPSGVKITSIEDFANASDLDEAGGENLLGAPHSELSGQEFQDYMRRIHTGTKHKTDKYKLPYIHRKSVRTRFFDEVGNEYSEEKMIAELSTRPQKLLKQNEKMIHSNGDAEQFYNIGLAALTGIAVDERTGKLIVVNTCPGAGECKIKCFAMGHGKVQFEGPWLSDGRILTYLINDPEGFKAQIASEIKQRYNRLSKNNIRTVIRWHDAGDFFSPEYLDLAFSLAKQFPDVDFYAYSKMASAVLAKKPKNFIINWSEGASTAQMSRL